MVEGPVAEAKPRLPRIRQLWIVFPIAVLLFSYADYLRRGNEVYEAVATNLEVPKASTFQRVVSLTNQSEFLGRVYDVTVALGTETGGGIWRVPRNAEMRLQLASDWKTRLLVIRPGHPLATTLWGALSEVLGGKARLLVVPHRGWIRLGRLPDGIAPFEVQIHGLLPGRFGFVRLPNPKTPDFRVFDISVVDEKLTGSVSGTIRYQLAVPAPVGPGEATKRFFFLASTSKILFGGLLVAVALLFFGTFLLSRERVLAGCSTLIFSVTLLHAVCLPPLHGADETSHGAALERIVFSGRPNKINDPYPRSVSMLAGSLDQDRVQFNPEIPLPLDGDDARREIAKLLEKNLATEALSTGEPAPGGSIEDSRNRAPLYFAAFSLFPVSWRDLSILDRVSFYRLVSSILAGLGVVAGVVYLGKAGFSSQFVLVYALVATLPFSVAVMASISNYSLAVGLGAFFSSATLVALASGRTVWRAVAGLVLLLGSSAAALIWKDFAFLALSSAVALTWAILATLLTRLPIMARKSWIAWLLPALPFLCAAWVLLPALSRFRPASLDHHFVNLLTLGDFRPYLLWMATPFLVMAAAALLALGLRHVLARSPAAVASLSNAAALALLVGMVAAFAATPFYTIPHDYRTFSVPEAIEAYARAIVSNNLAWDQDRITWKFVLGTFGWLDTHYPDWVYAVARWLAVALIVALPVVTRPFREKQPLIAFRLFLLFGFSLSLMSLSMVIRIISSLEILSSRFVLPLVPVALLPLFVQVEAPGRSRVLCAAFLALVALNVWTAITVLGARYYFGSPFPI
jgi:hypothetical protein